MKISSVYISLIFTYFGVLLMIAPTVLSNEYINNEGLFLIGVGGLIWVFSETYLNKLTSKKILVVSNKNIELLLLLAKIILLAVFSYYYLTKNNSIQLLFTLLLLLSLCLRSISKVRNTIK